MASRPSATSRRQVKGEYIETDSGNKVSRKASIAGTANITLGGKTVIQSDVILRGDLHRLPSTKPDGTGIPHAPTAISIGRCTVISSGCVLRPPSRLSRGTYSFYPMKIGDNVFIGHHSIVQAASISSHVYIAEHCVLQPFCIVKENVKILSHTVVPANMVIPSNSLVAGRPARVIGEVGEGWGCTPGAPGEGGRGATVAGEWVEGGELRELVRSIK
ncbi:dynactin subunit 5 [Patellaria atrata CBS 101060]|uniref:Dynactin subunit 5 n=1 Tax=Patellaria atrata CBS 101060 TaxID=1346257 RepID=A0A9P4VP18_9PEZI|nr:dynactin subunit 5 [Patellaria atrata CBS 101060]